MAKNIGTISSYSVEDLFSEIESRKVVLDRQSIQDWLFEYASETCEYEGIELKESKGYITHLIKSKLYDVLKSADENYWENNKPYLFSGLDKEEIPELVKKEHGFKDYEELNSKS